MASEQHDTVFPDEYIDEDEEESQEDEEEEEEEDDDVLVDDEEIQPSPSVSSALAVTVAVPSSTISNGALTAPISRATPTSIVYPDSSDSKRQRLDQIEEKKPLDDSRRLFQRLWTDEDEIELLQGFLEYTSQRGSSHHNDTAQFYDQIKSKLQLDFNKNQLVEKIRRLKKKYRNVLNKISSGKEFSFKSAHDQATFEISRKIWNNVTPIAGDNTIDDDEINLNPSPNLNYTPVILKSEAISTEKNTKKRSRPRSGIRSFEKNTIDGSASNRDRDFINLNLNNAHDANPNVTVNTATTTTTTTTPTNANNYNNNNCGGVNNNVAGLIEETVKSCLSPLLKELVAGAMGGPFGARGGFSMNPMGALTNLSFTGGEVVDEKWRKQQILELEVYSKRLELVQDQIKASLEELRSIGGGGG